MRIYVCNVCNEAESVHLPIQFYIYIYRYLINPWGEVTHEPSLQSPETSFSLTLKFETIWTRPFKYSFHLGGSLFVLSVRKDVSNYNEIQSDEEGQIFGFG